MSAADEGRSVGTAIDAERAMLPPARRNELELGEILLRTTRLQPEQLERARLRQRESHERLVDVLVEEGMLNADEVLAGVAEQLHLEIRQNLSPEEVDERLIQRVPISFAKQNRILPLAYDELRRLAHHQLGRERQGHTLGTTALVHEAYIKLAGADSLTWAGRAHFFAMCAQAMRRVLVNYAEARATAKRGGTALHVPIEDVVIRKVTVLGSPVAR